MEKFRANRLANVAMAVLLNGTALFMIPGARADDGSGSTAPAATPASTPPVTPAATPPATSTASPSGSTQTESLDSALNNTSGYSPLQLSEVTVTAEKQVGTEQNTPISMAVEPAESLQNRGIIDVTALAIETPGVSLKSNGPGQTEFEMRGMTSSGGNSPTVGFYLDDVALTAPAGAQNGKVVLAPPLFDIDRTEVLRGPQGTLYGSGSMGGTFKLIFNQPDLTQFQGSAQSTLSGTEGGGFNHNDNIMLNIPVVQDKLAIRIVATEAYTSGWIDRIVETPFPLVSANGAVRGDVLDGPDQQQYPQSNADQYDTLRGIILWKPTKRLTITASGDYMGDNQTGISAFDQFPGNLAHYEVFNIPEPKTDKEIIEDLNINYSFDSFDATLTTAYWARRSTQTEEASEMFDNPDQALAYYANYGLPNPGYYGPSGTGEAYGTEDDPTNQFSTELRFASTGKGPFQWVAGAYFTHYWAVWNFVGTTPNYASYMDIGTGAPATTPNWFDAYSPTTMEQYALYGNATYALTKKLKASVGLRVTDYDYQFASTISGWGSALGAATPSVQSDVTKSEAVEDPKFNLSYEYSSDLTTYFSAAEGFRPGGGNAAYPTTGVWAASFAGMNYTSGKWPSTYNSDSVWSYEIGAKSRWLGRRLMINASLYYEDWDHIQLLAYPDDWAFNINGNKATIYGGDIEVRTLLGGGFELTGSVGYLHDNLDGGPHWVISPTNVLPDVAPVNGNLNLSYSTSIMKKYVFKAEAETVYVGPRYSLSFLYYPGYVESGEYTQLPGYELTNFRVGVSSQQNDWSVTLFVNNAFNKQAYLEYLYTETQPSAAFNRVVSNQPLTGGVDISYRF
jgi:iron complex outermembrane receptor protein